MNAHKRFLYFEVAGPGTIGGIEDILCSFDTLEEAKKRHDEEVEQWEDQDPEDWIHYIYDRMLGQVVWCSDPKYIFNYS